MISCPPLWKGTAKLGYEKRRSFSRSKSIARVRVKAYLLFGTLEEY